MVNEFYPHLQSKNDGQVTHFYSKAAFSDSLTQNISTQDCIDRLTTKHSWEKKNKNEITKIPVGYIFPSFVDLPLDPWDSPIFWTYSWNYEQLRKGLVSPPDFPCLLDIMHQAFAAIEAFINVKFIPDPALKDSRLGNSFLNMEPKIIRIGFTTQEGFGHGRCYGFRNVLNSQQDYGGDVWIGFRKSRLDEEDIKILTRALIHELCHALGLDHPHQEQKTFHNLNQPETWGDTPLLTVMSYSTRLIFPYLGIHDIEALGNLWGLRKALPGSRHYIVDADKMDGNFFNIIDKNIFALDCSQTKRKSNLIIDGTYGVKKKSLSGDFPIINLMNEAKPVVLIGKSGPGDDIITGNDRDNIIIPYINNEISDSLEHNVNINGNSGNDIIFIPKYHGNININDYKGHNKIILPEHSLEKFRFYREENTNNLCITDVSRKIIKIVNFFNHLGNYAIYSADIFQLKDWNNTQVIVDQLRSLLKDKTWQEKKFNSLPVIGYSSILKTLVLRGEWENLKLSKLPEQILLADAKGRELKFSYSLDKNAHDLIIRQTLPRNDHLKGDNRLILQNFLIQNMLPKIHCGDGSKLKNQALKELALNAKRSQSLG